MNGAENSKKKNLKESADLVEFQEPNHGPSIENYQNTPIETANPPHNGSQKKSLQIQPKPWPSSHSNPIKYHLISIFLPKRGRGGRPVFDQKLGRERRKSENIRTGNEEVGGGSGMKPRKTHPWFKLNTGTPMHPRRRANTGRHPLLRAK